MISNFRRITPYFNKLFTNFIFFCLISFIINFITKSITDVIITWNKKTTPSATRSQSGDPPTFRRHERVGKTHTQLYNHIIFSFYSICPNKFSIPCPFLFSSIDLYHVISTLHMYKQWPRIICNIHKFVYFMSNSFFFRFFFSLIDFGHSKIYTIMRKGLFDFFFQCKHTGSFSFQFFVDSLREIFRQWLPLLINVRL